MKKLKCLSPCTILDVILMAGLTPHPAFTLGAMEGLGPCPVSGIVKNRLCKAFLKITRSTFTCSPQQTQSKWGGAVKPSMLQCWCTSPKHGSAGDLNSK